MENMESKKKQNNKGFSLVELIIVIAIMGILVGVVGTQVVPYMERSREAKDQQILSSVATAVTSAVAMSGESVTGIADTKLVDLGTAGANDTEKAVWAKVTKQVVDLLLPESYTDTNRTIAEAQTYLAKGFTSKKAKAKATAEEGGSATSASTIYISYFPNDGKLFVYLTKTGAECTKAFEKKGETFEIKDAVTLYVESN